MIERDQFRALAHIEGVPPETTEGLVRYVYDRIRPGSYLAAVLRNDLMDAAVRADLDNLAALPALVRLIRSEIPVGWYGSARTVEAHVLGERAA